MTWPFTAAFLVLLSGPHVCHSWQGPTGIGHVRNVQQAGIRGLQTRESFQEAVVNATFCGFHNQTRKSDTWLPRGGSPGDANYKPAKV